jgi:uracil phosphoribosyltransferase
MRDSLYEDVQFRLSEVRHNYGVNVHLLADPLMLSQLAEVCAKGTRQPQLNRLVAALYSGLMRTVINAEFPRKMAAIPTRMIDSNPHAIYQGEVIDPEVRAIAVNIARAGTLPSQVTYDLLNGIISPELVRQDHVVMSRMIDASDKVVGSAIGGAKIGGDVDDAILLFPDPMGATGGTLSTAIEMYRAKVAGKPRKIICVNLIVTPEYLKRITGRHPEVLIYAIRLDRGLSPTEVFGTLPGQLWDEERGLDDRQYIIPGGGGFGELMNNAYV